MKNLLFLAADGDAWRFLSAVVCFDGRKNHFPHLIYPVLPSYLIIPALTQFSC